MWTCRWAWSHHCSPTAPQGRLSSIPLLAAGSTGKHALADCLLAVTNRSGENGFSGCSLMFLSLAGWLAGCRVHKPLQPITFDISQHVSDESVSNWGTLWVNWQYPPGFQGQIPLCREGLTQFKPLAIWVWLKSIPQVIIFYYFSNWPLLHPFCSASVCRVTNKQPIRHIQRLISDYLGQSRMNIRFCISQSRG